MKKEIAPKWFMHVCAALLASMVVSFGAPGYRELKFIQSCKKAGEPFPVKKIQFRKWPVKRK